MDVDAYWFEDEVWQGFLPTESRSALLERHVFQTYVAGLRYFPDARDDSTFVPGNHLTLTPDPDNAWDLNAIAVWNEESTLQAGHIPAHIAVGLDPRRDRTALALYEQMEAGLRVNLGILISREPLTLRRVPDSDERAAWAAGAVAKLKAILAESHESVETTGDPMEQMRRMAEELRRREVT
jgi:hypothetical protein